MDSGITALVYPVIIFIFSLPISISCLIFYRTGNYDLGFLICIICILSPLLFFITAFLIDQSFSNYHNRMYISAFFWKIMSCLSAFLLGMSPMISKLLAAKNNREK